MKKSNYINQILLAVVVGIMALGCGSKEDQDMDPNKNDSGVYFMKAKVDGKLVEYKDQDLLGAFIGLSAPGVYTLTLIGGKDAEGQNGLEETITIILHDRAPITQKSYSGVTMNDDFLAGVFIGYIVGENDKFYITDPQDSDSFLELTEIKSGSIKGKFRGKVKDLASGTIKSITDGEFFVGRDD
jgi:hypothetical protein